jgi:hypothetical protein
MRVPRFISRVTCFIPVVIPSGNEVTMSHFTLKINMLNHHASIEQSDIRLFNGSMVIEHIDF